MSLENAADEDDISSLKLAHMFGDDDDLVDDPRNNEGSASAEPAPSVTEKFCCSDRQTPLDADEGDRLWNALRRIGYRPCSIRSGSKAPYGKAWQKNAFADATGWQSKAPGIGLVCGGLNSEGKPVAVQGSLAVLDFDFRLINAANDYDRRARDAASNNRPDAARLRDIADELKANAPKLAELEQGLFQLLAGLPGLAQLRASALLRSRAGNPNFALLVRNAGTLGNEAPKLYFPVQVGDAMELVEAFGIDLLASGKQLVCFHLHPATGRPWLWEEDRSPETVPLGVLPQITKADWTAMWREIADAAETLGLVEDAEGAPGPCSEQLKSNALGVTAARLRELGVGPNIPNNTDRPRPNAESMRATLQYLAERGYFEHRNKVVNGADGRILKLGWIETGMALKVAYGDDVGFDLWGVTHIDERARGDAPAQWESFKPQARPGDVTIATIIKAAKDAGSATDTKTVTAEAPGFVSYGPYTMSSEEGLTKLKNLKSGPVYDWVSAPFEVLGACRDPNGRAWGKQLRFRDADNRVHMYHIQDAALHGEPGVLCAALAHEGLAINRAAHRDFAEYLSSVTVVTRLTVVDRTGWHAIGGRNAFVLPSETIMQGDSERVELDALAKGPYEARGSLEDWKRGVGTLTADHALPVFMVSAAIAGPLVHLLGAEGGGVHIFGGSSIGKSATLKAAASVWGRGATPGYVRSWRATANGLEGAAASATDTCLVLDEIGVAEARDVAASVYALANGVGKARAGRDGSAREPKSWRVTILSSGELPVETKLAEDRGRKTRAGQLVRLLDIPADRGLGYGAFDSAGGYADGGKLADAIKDASAVAYGTAGPEFVRKLVAADVDEISAMAKSFMDDFVDRLVEQDASEQVRRAAKTFALIALAGEMAAHWKITPWTRGCARKAAAWGFQRWVEKRGGAGSHEEHQAIQQVRLLIEQHGEARFQRTDGVMAGGEVRDRLGWRNGDGDMREWWVPPEVWRAVVCEGLDPQSVARTLYKHRMLRRQDKKSLRCVVKIGSASKRAYVLTAAILADGSEM